MINLKMKKVNGAILAVLLVIIMGLFSFATIDGSEISNKKENITLDNAQNDTKVLAQKTKDRMAAYARGEIDDQVHDRVYKRTGDDDYYYRLPTTVEVVPYGQNEETKTDNGVDNVEKYFIKYFSNKLQVISVGEIKEKSKISVNLSGLNSNQLKFYTYDILTNVYEPLTITNLYIDDAGRLNFTTNVGGYIVVSEGKLIK